MTAPFIAIRLWPQHHENPGLLEELLAQFRRYPGCCDEVWFCTGFGFPTLAEHRRSAGQLAFAAAKVRAAGIRASIQVAATIGHKDMPVMASEGISWQCLVGPDGAAATMCNCPRAPGFHEYAREMGRIYAACKPYRVMVDDDLRMDHHGDIVWPCFCPVCLDAFSRAQGRRWQREALVKALNRPGAGGRLRLAWTRFNAQSLAVVAGAVARGVRAVSPATRMGFQHVGHELTIYSGPDWKPVLEAMARVSGHPVSSRPGHGFYNDRRPRDMIDKAFLIADQNARLPACVDTICPEIENFTHNAMGKTAHGMAVESTLDLAVGCDSLSYAILCSGHETPDWYGRNLLRKLAEWRPFWVEMVRANRGTRCGGMAVVTTPRQAGRIVRKGENPFAWAQLNVSAIYQLAAVGLPVSMEPATARAFALHADVVPALSDADLRCLLAGGVLMDGTAALRVQERGFGRLLGVHVAPFGELDSQERLTRDTLNGAFAGTLWTEWFASPRAAIYRLTPNARRLRVLGEFVNREQRVVGAATTCFRNALGGRVAVLGSEGWQNSFSSAKRWQLLAAADWVSGGRLPVLIETAAQAMAVPRVDARGRLRSVTLLNTSIDTTPRLTVRLRGVRGSRARWVLPDGSEKSVRLVRDGRDRVAEVPAIGPWEIGYLSFR
jgi:hypothetical protein